MPTGSSISARRAAAAAVASSRKVARRTWRSNPGPRTPQRCWNRFCANAVARQPRSHATLTHRARSYLSAYGRGRGLLRPLRAAGSSFGVPFEQQEYRSMPRTLIVIGASAGGIRVLLDVVAGLQPDIPAAIMVVVHLPPYHRTQLPELLSKAGPLPASAAQHGEPIREGHIYVAPPDRHMLVRDHHIELNRGPRENRARPAIDPLFRSAARVYRANVAGVILSGMQGDGTVGLMAIKSQG